jgi:nucleoside-diphosphate-sugar epimerase
MCENSPAPVLVTGGTGFIGSHLVELLVAGGARVRCLVRRKSSLAYLPTGRIELAYGDLVSGEGLAEALQGVRTVYHIAGVTKATAVERFYTGNVKATENLLAAIEDAPEKPARLVHVSSLAAMGPSADGVPLMEDARPRPLTHYGKSKLEGERIVRNSAFASRTVIVRPPVVYGPRDTDVYLVFRSASRGVALRIGSEESYFSYIYVQDLARMLVAAAAAESAAGRTYFAGNAEPASWGQFNSEVAKLAGRKIHNVSVPPFMAHTLAFLSEVSSRLRGSQSILSREKVREARCRYWVANTSRAERELGFQAATSLEDGIAKTFAWYRNSGWLS